MVKAMYCLIVAGTLMLSSCATTTLLHVWKDPAYQGTARKTVVIMVAQKAYIRNSLEDQFTAALKARGNDAQASYPLIPVDQLPDKEAVASKIRNTGADTVLVSRLVDKKTVETYVPGRAYAAPGYYGGWGSYYGTAVSSPGYTFESQYAYIETNLYDMKTEKLIWTAKSETEISLDDQQLIKTFVDVIIDGLAADKIIK